MDISAHKLAYTKRAKPVIRDSVLMTEAHGVHPLVEKASRAISDWHSEVDWPIHTDQAIRAIEAVAEQLGREGYRDAQEYLQSLLWNEPRPRNNLSQTRKPHLTA
jgi:hypothetical protein